MVFIKNRSIKRLLQALLVAFGEEQHRFCSTFRRLQQALKKPFRLWLTATLRTSSASPVDWDFLLSSPAATGTSSPCPISSLRASKADDRALNHDGTCTSRALMQWDGEQSDSSDYNQLFTMKSHRKGAKSQQSGASLFPWIINVVGWVGHDRNPPSERITQISTKKRFELELDKCVLSFDRIL